MSRKSKKRSATSSQPAQPESVIFVDRDLGKRFAEALRVQGWQVEIHDDHFAQDTTDEQWLGEVGRRGWVAVTNDKRIELRQTAIAIIRQANARVFVLGASGALTAEQKAETIAKAKSKVERLIRNMASPYIVRVHRDGSLRTVWPAELKRKRAQPRHGE